MVMIPRGLLAQRFGDGVNGGLPGNDGAHTICSGDAAESPLFTERFSFPSIMTSMRCKSPDTDDDRDAERSRMGKSDDKRRTDKSSGVVLPSLNSKENLFFWKILLPSRNMRKPEQTLTSADDSPFVCSIYATRCDLLCSIHYRCLCATSLTHAVSALSLNSPIPMNSIRLHLVVAQLSPVRSAVKYYFAK